MVSCLIDLAMLFSLVVTVIGHLGRRQPFDFNAAIHDNLAMRGRLRDKVKPWALVAMAPFGVAAFGLFMLQVWSSLNDSLAAEDCCRRSLSVLLG